MAEAFFFLIAVLVIVFILAILPPPEEGTLQEMKVIENIFLNLIHLQGAKYGQLNN